MRRTPYPRDARLWSYLISEFRAAGVTSTEMAERYARRAVAAVRRERDQDGITSWGPGDDVPNSVVWVYDLDGDVWERPPGGRWKCRRFDPDDMETAASGEYDSAELLDAYGPVTGTREAEV